MSLAQSLFYWAIIGALLGMGLLLTFSIGLPLIVLAVVLVLYLNRRKLRVEALWMALVTMGILPASVLIYQYIAPANTPLTVAVSFPPGYLYAVALFSVIGFVGIVLGLVLILRGRTKR